jgi:hypothetical protein
MYHFVHHSSIYGVETKVGSIEIVMALDKTLVLTRALAQHHLLLRLLDELSTTAKILIKCLTRRSYLLLFEVLVCFAEPIS